MTLDRTMNNSTYYLKNDNTVYEIVKGESIGNPVMSDIVEVECYGEKCYMVRKDGTI